MYKDTAEKMSRELYMLESGQPMKRPIGSLPPCYHCPKIPGDAPAKTPEHAIEPTEKSLTALWHYKKCRAVRRFPEDEIVERNAGIIDQVRQFAEEAKGLEAAHLMAVLMNRSKG